MTETTFYPLEHLALIGISGTDALDFLQGQGTQDYHRLTSEGPLPGAFCTAKGRVVSNVINVLVGTDPSDLKLVLHASAVPGLQRHLGKYIPFFRGSHLVDDRLHYHGLGLAGGEPAALLDDWLEATGPGVWQRGGHFAFTLADGRAQLWLDARSEDYESWLESVERQRVQPADDWRRLDIEAGQPWVEADQEGDFIPQMLNLDSADGISFRKGCYTGQEVVARLHYKGQSKRRLARLSWQGNSQPDGPGPYTERGSGGQWVNWVADEGGGAALAVVRQGETQPRLYLDEAREQTLALL